MKNLILNTIGNLKILSVFPELYNYSSVAPFILRIALGIMFIKNGYAKNNIFGSVFKLANVIIGIFLFIGLYTQPVAIIAVAISLIKMFGTIRSGDKPDQNFGYYLLSFAISVSLALLGPGIFALDLPL